MHWECIVGTVLGGTLCLPLGYYAGKHMLFLILERHIDGGLTAEKAIAYERAVFMGKVPRE